MWTVSALSPRAGSFFKAAGPDSPSGIPGLLSCTGLLWLQRWVGAPGKVLLLPGYKTSPVASSQLTAPESFPLLPFALDLVLRK